MRGGVTRQHVPSSRSSLKGLRWCFPDRGSALELLPSRHRVTRNAGASSTPEYGDTIPRYSTLCQHIRGNFSRISAYVIILLIRNLCIYSHLRTFTH